ncbi:MAG TPA: hypothetical protein H9707_09020 [Candidatus Butyricicoccus avicola]|nr:hypothetical protein [Candidatus Butyricicoccus avicola]
MKDRIPSPGMANRVSLTQDNGQIITGVLSYADNATQEGSAYNKANVLPDDVCAELGINSDTAEPKDAWLANRDYTDEMYNNATAFTKKRLPTTFQLLMTGRLI